jgi:hypothetical protein
MTVGLLEGLTSSIGDELTALSGFRSTRTTALVDVEDRIQTDVNNASSVDSGLNITFSAPIPNTGPIVIGLRFRMLSDPGTNILQSGVATVSGLSSGTRVVLSAGSFAASVQPGRKFKITTGPLSGKTAFINKRVSSVEILLDGTGLGSDFTNESWDVLFDLVNRHARIAGITFAGPNITGLALTHPLGANFTTQSWEVVQDAPTTIPVENTLDWEAVSEAFVGPTRYRYDSKTLTTLDSLRASRHLGRDGRIVAIAGILIADGAKLSVDDGQGDVKTFEFQKTATAFPDIQNITLNITNLMTATQVRDVIIDGIVNLADMNLRAFPGTTTDAVELRHAIPGGTGRIDVTDTVTDAGFLTEGPRGIEAVVQPLEEVIDFSLKPSGIDQYRNSFIVERAVGEELSTLGRNIGVSRPSALQNDEIFRRLIAAMAYAPRGTILAIELVLDAILGPGNWELFEDLTLGSLNHPCEIFFRRRDDNELKSVGKAFLDGDENRAMATASTLTLAADPTPGRVEGLRLAPEGVERLIAFGSTATVVPGANQTAAVTGPAASFPTAVKPGDIFYVTTGPYKGTQGTIQARNSDFSLTLGPLRGSENIVVTQSFTEVGWKIVRRRSNFRHYRPSEEFYIERSGGPSTQIWTAQGTLAASEATYVTFVTDTQGQYLQIVDSGGGAVAADTMFYQHLARIDRTSLASFAVHMNIGASAVFPVAGDNSKQASFQIEDGVKLIMVGMTWDGVGDDRDIGFIDSTGAYIGTPVNVDIAPVSNATVWKNIEIVKVADKQALLLIGGHVVQAVPYASLSASANRRIAFGAQSTGNFGVMVLKEVDWGIITPRDFWNERPANFQTTAAEHVTDVAGTFRSSDDDLPVKKRVRLFDWSALNSGGGNVKGEWEIDTYVSDGDVSVTGPRLKRGLFTFEDPFRFTGRDNENAFTWPDARGHSVQILTGPNAGIYPISKIIDPVTGRDVQEPPTNLNGNPKWLRAISTDPTDGTYGVIAVPFPIPPGFLQPLNPAIRVWGKVGGVYVFDNFTLIPGFGLLSISPTFDAASIVAIECVDVVNLGAGDGVGGNRMPTFRGDVIVFEGPENTAVTDPNNRTEVIRLPAGQRSYGGRELTRLHAAGWTSSNAQQLIQRSHIVVLDTAAGVPARPNGFAFTDVEADWRIVPNFPVDPSVKGEIVDAGTVAGATLTLRNNLPITPVGEYPIMAAARSLVLSAQLLDEKESNTLLSLPSNYSHYPFYLADNFGFVRTVVDLVTAAGVIPDFDRLFRDASGPHLIGRNT